MSSLDDLAVAQRHNDDMGVVSTVPPGDVLAAVKAEGGRRRTRRHRRNAGVGVLGLVLLAVPVLALLPGDDEDSVTVAADVESTTLETSKPTTVTTVVGTDTTLIIPLPTTTGSTPAPTVGRRPAVPRTTAPPETTIPVETTVPLVCQNSVDPACGPFRWDPDPGPNQALIASFVDPPAQAVVGEEVTFTVSWSDGDADPVDYTYSPDGTVIGGPCQVGERYGPWTPPAPQPGSGTLTIRHTFTSAGVHPVRVHVFTGDVCAHPYASETTVETWITVEETAPPPP